MATMDTRFRLADDVTFQLVGPGGDNTVVLSLESGFFYTCNETTAAFLKAADGKRALGEIVEILQEEFDVSRDQLQADMTELAEKLLREKLLVAVAPEDVEDK